MGKIRSIDNEPGVFACLAFSDLREGKVRMVQMNLPHPSAPANPSSPAKRGARGFSIRSEQKRNVQNICVENE